MFTLPETGARYRWRFSAGAALSGVELALWPEWQANAKGSTSDADGHFVVEDVPVGKVDVLLPA